MQVSLHVIIVISFWIILSDLVSQYVLFRSKDLFFWSGKENIFCNYLPRLLYPHGTLWGRSPQPVTRAKICRLSSINVIKILRVSRFFTKGPSSSVVFDTQTADFGSKRSEENSVVLIFAKYISGEQYPRGNHIRFLSIQKLIKNCLTKIAFSCDINLTTLCQ